MGTQEQQWAVDFEGIRNELFALEEELKDWLESIGQGKYKRSDAAVQTDVYDISIAAVQLYNALQTFRGWAPADKCSENTDCMHRIQQLCQQLEY